MEGCSSLDFCIEKKLITHFSALNILKKFDAQFEVTGKGKIVKSSDLKIEVQTRITEQQRRPNVRDSFSQDDGKLMIIYKKGLRKGVKYILRK